MIIFALISNSMRTQHDRSTCIINVCDVRKTNFSRSQTLTM